MEGCEDQPREGDRTLTRASQGSTGRTALPEHEARAWECGVWERGRRGRQPQLRKQPRAPPARALRLPRWAAAQPRKTGSWRPETQRQQAVGGASTHPRVPLLSRAPQPAFLRPTLPLPRDLPLALFTVPAFLGISVPTGSRAAARAPGPVPSCLNPQPSRSIHGKEAAGKAARRRKSPLHLRTQRTGAASLACASAVARGRHLPAGGSKTPRSSGTYAGPSPPRKAAQETERWGAGLWSSRDHPPTPSGLVSSWEERIGVSGKERTGPGVFTLLQPTSRCRAPRCFLWPLSGCRVSCCFSLWVPSVY